MLFMFIEPNNIVSSKLIDWNRKTGLVSSINKFFYWIRNRSSRIIIVGPGGVGKTILAKFLSGKTQTLFLLVVLQGIVLKTANLNKTFAARECWSDRYRWRNTDHLVCDRLRRGPRYTGRRLEVESVVRDQLSVIRWAHFRAPLFYPAVLF